MGARTSEARLLERLADTIFQTKMDDPGSMIIRTDGHADIREGQRINAAPTKERAFRYG